MDTRVAAEGPSMISSAEGLREGVVDNKDIMGYDGPRDPRESTAKAGGGGSTAGDTATTVRPSEYSLPHADTTDSKGHRHGDSRLLDTVADEPLNGVDNDVSIPSGLKVLTTVESAIASGSPGTVSALLDKLGRKSTATEQLTGCYGGRYFEGRRGIGIKMGMEWGPDDNGLLSMTNPLLHAARTGRSEMVSEVVSAARDKLRPQQVKVLVLAKDAKLRSVLTLALASGCKGAFEASLKAVEAALNPDEVKGLIMGKDADGDNILHWATDSGDGSLVNAVLNSLRHRLLQAEMKELMLPEEGSEGAKRTILHSAVASGNRSALDAILAETTSSLTPKEMGKMLTTLEEGTRHNILQSAIISGSLDMLEGVLAAVRKHLSGDEVRCLMVDAPSVWFGLNVHLAANCRSAGMFETVLAELEEEVGEPEVRDMMASTAKYHGSLLHSAVESGSRVIFEAVLGAVQKRLGTREVQRMMTSSTTIHGTILHSAVASGVTEVFEVVLSAMQETLTPDKVRVMMRHRNRRSKVTILHSAAAGESKSMFEMVLAALEMELTPDEVETMLVWTREVHRGSRESGTPTILHLAVDSRSRDTFEGVLAALHARLTRDEIRDMMVATGAGGENILHRAARSGTKGVFEAVVAGLDEGLTSGEVSDLLVPTSDALGTLLEHAATSGNVGLWRAVVGEAARRLPTAQGSGKLSFKRNLPEHLLRMVALQGDLGMWKAVLEELRPLEVRELIHSRDGVKGTLLWAAVTSRDPATIKAVLQCVRGPLSTREACSEAFCGFVASGFSACTAVVLGVSNEAAATALEADDGELGWAIEVYSTLLQHPMVLDPEEFVLLSRKKSYGWLRNCFLETVLSADNPFIPGFNLSVVLTKATSRAPEGERKKLLRLLDAIDAFLLEVLERLPQTVRAFHGGMAGCCHIFEPECSSSNGNGRQRFLGPLAMALQERHQVEKFCTRPLLMDFLSRRFTHGLPNMMDTNNVLRDQGEIENLAIGRAKSHHDVGGCADDGDRSGLSRDSEAERKTEDATSRRGGSLLLDFQDRLSTVAPLLGKGRIIATVLSPCVLLQGANYRCVHLPELTISRGTQFVVAGLAASPDQYYRVPAMRMLLDLVVCVGTLAVFSTTVLCHSEGPLNAGEKLFAFYVMAGFTAEGRDVLTGFSSYVVDRWNVLDLLGLGLVAGGLISRLVDETNPWGRALYALSAPLLFSRLLFFAQFLRFQGPVIQVFWTVTVELAKFAVVMLVVMIGFAMSFHALFGNVESFGETCLHLFKGLLGDTNFFDVFSEGDYDAAASFLFCVYLVVIAVMLFNLLIAVLSTSHSRIEEKADQEFRVSKALLIEHYRMVVGKHLLPPPFNLVQLLVAFPTALLPGRQVERQAMSSNVKEAVGRLTFWLVLGPVAAVSGSLLWVVSAVHACFAWRRYYDRGMSQSVDKFEFLPGCSTALRYAVILSWCTVGAPMLLVTLWMTAPLEWIGLQPWRWVWDHRYPICTRRCRHISAKEMLRKSRGGLSTGDIHLYLENPMDYLEVRQRDKTEHATVEHMKRLRDRFDKRLSALEKSHEMISVKIDKVVDCLSRLVGEATVDLEFTSH